MKKYRKGFTLIEMLIVITIIALLASLILVGMGGARAKTRDSRRIADLHNVMNALELYYAKYYSYPDVSSWSELSSTLTQEGGIGVSRIPDDPLAARTYQYGVANDGQDYVLGANLETQDAALDNDIDGSVYGIDCDDPVDDPVYCIRP
jgi:prepilin-type N-terminal cleavage/methylation domain-containing protein